MDMFEYHPIDLTGPSFRLIRLLRRSGADIKCDIFDASLAERESAISYESLSYTWGGMDKKECILVNGKSLRVTWNLYSALLHLQLDDEDRILWIDAICIDQSNMKERGHQVQQMGAIYQHASRVIFWLGEGTLKTSILMKSLTLLEAESRKVACSSWKPTDERWNSLWETANQRMRSDYGSGLRAMLNKGFQSLLDHPWFRRVWILQEVAGAKAAIVCCGKASVRARVFALAPAILQIEPDTHCQAVFDIMPGSSRVNSWWNEKRDLYNVLQKFQNSQTSEERDILYALLGLTSDASKPGTFTADYTKLIVEVIDDLNHFLFPYTDPRLWRRVNMQSIVQYIQDLPFLNHLALIQALDFRHSKAVEHCLNRINLHVELGERTALLAACEEFLYKNMEAINWTAAIKADVARERADRPALSPGTIDFYQTRRVRQDDLLSLVVQQGNKSISFTRKLLLNLLHDRDIAIAGCLLQCWKTRNKDIVEAPPKWFDAKEKSTPGEDFHATRTYEEVAVDTLIGTEHGEDEIASVVLTAISTNRTKLVQLLVRTRPRSIHVSREMIRLAQSTAGESMLKVLREARIAMHKYWETLNTSRSMGGQWRMARETFRETQDRQLYVRCQEAANWLGGNGERWMPERYGE